MGGTSKKVRFATLNGLAEPQREQYFEWHRKEEEQDKCYTIDFLCLRIANLSSYSGQ